MKKYYFLIIVALILGLVLTGCTLLSNIGQTPTSEQSGIAYLTKNGSPPGLVGLWHFDGNTDDSSVYGNHGTVFGANYVPSPMGQALSFDGVDDYVNCGSGAILKPTQNITIEMWVKPSSTQNQYADILGGHQNNQGYVVQQDSTDPNNYYFAYNNNGTSGGWQGMWITTQLAPDVWQHFVVQKEGNTIRHFLNGTLSDSGTVSGDIYYSPNEPFYIGIGWNLSSNRYFKGLIDEVRIWNTLTEIVINGCYTGVADTLFEGKLISVYIQEFYDLAKNHGQFVRSVTVFTNKLMKAGIITGEEKGKIQSCAAQANQLPKEKGLVLWLDAGKGITSPVNGGLVSIWEDQSGSGNDAAQTDTSYQPTYITNGPNGKAVVRFDGSNDFLITESVSLGNSISVFAVVKAENKMGTEPHDWRYNQGIVTQYINGRYILEINSTAIGFQFYDGDWIKADADATFWQLYGVVREDSFTKRLYLNGVEVNSKDTNTGTSGSTNPIKIGFSGDYSRYLKGYIAEILVYDRILTVHEREMVETYLNAKYDIY